MLNQQSSITYLPFGPLTGLTYGNSKTLSASYDQDYRPTNRTVSGVFNHAYDTDADGNITQKGVRTYTYDVLERLNAEAGGTATSFTYDGIGNRLTEVAGGTTNYTYPSTNSKLSSVGANSYTYDAMGNVTGDTARTYVWSAAGLLKEAKIGGTTVGAYTYSTNNQRTKKVAGGTTTHYVYGLGGLLTGEYDNSGVLIREYVWLNGEPLAQIDKSGGTETVTYLHTDHLATPRYGTNAAGSTVWTWDSGAFGKEAATGTATVNLRFPGQYYDAESSLFYNWSRYYNPATGRYITSDPIGLEGGLNTFNYAAQSPLTSIDPEGQEEIDINQHITSIIEEQIFGVNVCGCILKTFMGIDDLILVGTAIVGSDVGGFEKKRVTIGEGGPSGNKTSSLSKRQHKKIVELRKKLKLGKERTRKIQKLRKAREIGRKLAKFWVPGLGLILVVYNVYEYTECAINCEVVNRKGPICAAKEVN
ncbi:MAG: hypothetical protein IPH06_02745 [Alphaproteobacteria bacterium]|nr:hypothetical protein [Alphaproteobacteria bacterium]QQS56962.1 MAG: hypothetical protein IPN28_12000 [Alphaproteobacteria bacterium]